MPGSTSADPLIGRRVSSYTVEELLGAGGMGSVYRGVQPDIGKKVAIKFLADHLNAVPDVVARFFHEAKAVNVIGHENIVDIFDFGRTPEGRNYFVMELLDGPSLEKMLVSQGAFSPARTVEIARQIASALAAAHARGVIHRDLKPENVFLLKRAGREDFVKILDFGIAKLAPKEGEAADGKTRSGMILGTPGYMAPEQASGDPIDARADVYALGVVMYRMLAGQIPFAAESFTATLLRQLTEVPRPLHEIRADSPIELSDLVDRMLKRLPGERPQTMSEVEAALVLIAARPLGREVAWLSGAPGGVPEAPLTLKAGQHAIEGGPLLGDPTFTDPKDQRPVEREPRRSAPIGIIAAGALAVVVSGLGAAWIVSSQRTPKPVGTADAAVKVAPPVNPTPVAAVDASAPASGAFTVHVESTPPGAEISDGQRVLGRTPADVRLEAAGPLFLRHAGYREERIEAHRTDGTVRAALRRVPTTSLPRPPTKGINLDD